MPLILPGIELCYGVPQRSDFHRYDVFEHIAQTVKFSHPSVRLAAALHDIGKGICHRAQGNAYGHEIVGAEMAERILGRQGLKCPKKLVDEMVFLVRYHMYDLKNQTSENKVRMFIVRNFPLICKLMLLKQADFLGCGKESGLNPTVKRWQAILEKMRREKAPFAEELEVDGRNMLGLGCPPAQISKVLDSCLRTAYKPSFNKGACPRPKIHRCRIKGQALGGMDEGGPAFTAITGRGTFPAELVRELKEKGIEVASLADHDSVAGISEFIGASKKEGIVAISGIELSTFSLAEIHILGYNVDINNQKFFQALEGLRQLRRKRLLEILEKLKEFKIDMPEEEVAKKAGKSESAGRVHIARALTERGICGSVAEAFDKLLGYGKPAYVPSHRISPREGIEIIKAGGGKAVLAHPFLTGLEPQGLACLVRELKSCGLNGIEAQYSTHTIGETQFLLKLAKAEGLIATCGPDFGRGRERPKAFDFRQDFKGLMS